MKVFELIPGYGFGRRYDTGDGYGDGDNYGDDGDGAGSGDNPGKGTGSGYGTGNYGVYLNGVGNGQGQIVERQALSEETE